MGKEKVQHKKQTEVRLAKRSGFIQRLRFSNLWFNYKDSTPAGDRL